MSDGAAAISLLMEDGVDPDIPRGTQPTNQPKFKDVLCYEELGKEYANSMLENDKG